MNSPETQSDSSSQESYFDPEVMDTSEQEFSASLERSDQPSFIVDSPENLPAKVTENQDVERMASRPSQTQGHSEIAGNEAAHSDWRDQVSAKVKHYKTLKPRKERYPSLQLQFDTVVPWKSEKPSLAAER